METAEKQEDIILCPYCGTLRWVHPEACKWHRDENDPECRGCTPDVRRKDDPLYVKTRGMEVSDG